MFAYSISCNKSWFSVISRAFSSWFCYYIFICIIIITETDTFKGDCWLQNISNVPLYSSENNTCMRTYPKNEVACIQHSIFLGPKKVQAILHCICRTDTISIRCASKLYLCMDMKLLLYILKRQDGVRM